jgi:putative membrane-bound dehydrogenase-like protein
MEGTKARGLEDRTPAMARVRPGASLPLLGAFSVLAAAATTTGFPLRAEEPAAPDYSAELPRIAPQEPAASLATFQLVAGFRIEPVATEPLIADPVAVSCDEDGRLYVVCMRDYSEQAEERLGEVRLLRDGDGDGRYDAASVFLDGLSWPTGVIAWEGGAFVAAAPDVFYAKDKDGDGRADLRRAVFTGFGRGNVQGLLNSLRWGLDHRIHGATSSSGGSVRAAAAPDSAPALDLRGRDFAFDPRTEVLEATSGGAQHGLSFDDWGRKLVCSNSSHLEMVLYEERYLRRSPHLAAPGARSPIAPDGGQAEVFRASPVEPWRLVRTRLRVAGKVPGPIEGGGRAAGYFTGATGVMVYRGDAWPEECRGQVFIGDVGSNIVHRKALEPDGVGLRGRRIDAGREFLASSEIWFRPVQLENGPDGALHVIDMYREVIEHPASLPPAIKKHLDLTSGRDRGRIWRIVPAGFAPRPAPRLGGATTEELVALLEHRNGWHRDTAARLLHERQDPQALGPLERLAAGSPLPEGRVTALWALDGLGALAPAPLLAALADPHPRVREHAVRLAEGVVSRSPAVRDALCGMAADGDPRVRYQLAFTLGEIAGEAAGDAAAARRDAALLALARRDGTDPWLRLAVQTSVGGRAGAFLAALLGDEELRRSAAGQEMAVALAAQAGAEGRRDAVVEVFRALDLLPPGEGELAGRVARELAAALPGSGKPLADLLAPGTGAGEIVAGLVRAARETALDGARPAAARAEAARTLALGSFAPESEVLARLLDPREPQEVQLAALGALARFDAPAVARVIISRWGALGPAARAEAAEALCARAERVAALLDAIESEELRAGDLEPARRDGLRAHPDAALRARASRLLAQAALARREEVVAAYQEALRLEGDGGRGREVFRRACAACHEVDGIGSEIGPNLGGMRGRGREAILLNVLDPNRELNPEYASYAAVTRDGRAVTGMIAAETATSITFRRREDQRETLLRRDLAALETTGLSLMPEGLETEIDLQGMADLLAFLAPEAESAAARSGPDEGGLGRKGGGAPGADGWRAGAARRRITPEEPLWMSGYGARDRPAEGTLTDLWAKALALEDPEGRRALLVTLDLVGIDRDLSLALRRAIALRHRLDLERIALATSHTHTGPVVRKNLEAMYFLEAAAWQRVEAYGKRLEEEIARVADEAVSSLAPARLSWGIGKAAFAVNRRENREAEVPELRAAGKLAGPVDHDVPVLRVTSGGKSGGKLAAVVFGYACHATVLSFYEWSGDYPGFAQMALEEAHPGAVALFWAGCGGDQNPLPRRTVELAKEHGAELARAVGDVLAGDMRPVEGTLGAAYAEIALHFAERPGRDALEERAKSADRFEARHARLLLETLAKDGALPSTYPYPVQSWRLGKDLLFVILGGEVVVDYSLRLKRELGPATTWVAAYANDVMAYIPSRRVLLEGGYEGATSMRYYGQPALWAPEVEEAIVRAVHAQAARLREAARE